VAGDGAIPLAQAWWFLDTLVVEHRCASEMKTVVLEMTLPAPPLGGDPGRPSATEHRVGHDGNCESVRSDQVSANARRLAAIELSHETEHTVSEFDQGAGRGG
jgi:hypothetical protein